MAMADEEVCDSAIDSLGSSSPPETLPMSPPPGPPPAPPSVEQADNAEDNVDDEEDEEDEKVLLQPLSGPCDPDIDDDLPPPPMMELKRDTSLQQDEDEDDEEEAFAGSAAFAQGPEVVRDLQETDGGRPLASRGLALTESPTRGGRGLGGDLDDDDEDGHGLGSGCFVNSDDAPPMRPSSGADPGADPGVLISRELLDELSHEPENWNEDNPTAPMHGFETPSEPGTPTLRETPEFESQGYYATDYPQVKNEGLMCIDQWDWKTDAPEFVPGSMKAAWAVASPMPDANHLGGLGGGGSHIGVNSPDGHHGVSFCSEYEWQLRTKADELREMQNRVTQCEMETTQVRASWEMDRQKLVRQINHYRTVLERYCVPLDEASSTAAYGGIDHSLDDSGNYWGYDQSGPSQWGSGSHGVNGSPSPSGQNYQAPGSPIPSGYAGGGASGAGYSPANGAGGGASSAGYSPANAAGTGPAAEAPVGSSLDSKMRQLNSLLQERNTQSQQGGLSSSPMDGPLEALDSTDVVALAAGSEMNEGREAMAASGTGGGYSSGSIASTLRAMFPHATIRTSRAENVGEEDDEPDAGIWQSGDGLEGAEPVVLDLAPRESPRGETIEQSRAVGSDERAVQLGVRAVEQMVASSNSEARAVDQMLRRLERSTGERFDDRAMRHLQALPPKEAREALQKVEDSFNQGGLRRSLSSTLQSACRKIEKRSGSGRVSKPEDDGSRTTNAAATSSTGKPLVGGGLAARLLSEGLGDRDRRKDNGDDFLEHRSGSGGRADPSSLRSSRWARKEDEDGDAFESASGSDGNAEGKASTFVPRRDDSERADQTTKDMGDEEDEPLLRTTSVQSHRSVQSQNSVLDTPMSKRSNRSWADIQSGDEKEEDDHREAGLPSLAVAHATGTAAAATAGNSGERRSSPEDDYWTPHQVERTARRGFELRRRGDHWDLKICMSALTPAFTEVGMERYCRWLRVRLTSFRDEHGSDSLRRCRGEVDFSHNRMSNQMVWMLLETLAQHEVHTALLKLFNNSISQGGVLAICEFIKINDRAEALQELHLSHNEIDDESALELLRTLNMMRPRYPPRRLNEGSGDREPVFAPVWLRLNHNRISQPDQVRRVAESEGITMCSASDRQACGTSRCWRRECPLVHLYSFNVQGRRERRHGDSQQQNSSEVPRTRDRGDRHRNDPGNRHSRSDWRRDHPDRERDRHGDGGDHATVEGDNAVAEGETADGRRDRDRRKRYVKKEPKTSKDESKKDDQDGQEGVSSAAGGDQNARGPSEDHGERASEVAGSSRTEEVAPTTTDGPPRILRRDDGDIVA